MGNYVCNVESLGGGIFYCGSSCNIHDADELEKSSSNNNFTITTCDPPQKLAVFPNKEEIIDNKTSSCHILDHETPDVHRLYRFGRELGRGCSGITYSCTEIETGIEYACKSIPKRRLKTIEEVEDVRREIKVMQYLCGEKDIVKLKAVYEDVLSVHIVMELCSGGELFNLIKKKGYFSETEAAKLIKVVVGVVETCHSLGVMHRDLKPENFVLLNKDKDEEEEDFNSLRAIDFGFSVFFKPGQVFTERVGSLYYVAPEVINKHYGPEADIWSTGVILYILLSGVPPFWAETAQEQHDEILKGHIDFESEPWPQISDSAKDLIQKMLCLQTSERLTAGQVLSHPWICQNIH